MENFKGWKQCTISLPSSGTTLLSGPSGKGKSSLLDAIIFAITGTCSGKINHINSKKGASVSLKIGNIHILRSRAPNKLSVTIDDESYENVQAQNYLDDFFSPYFSKIGYIRQKGYAAFLQMSSSAKMDFLQEWILADPSIFEIKKSAKALQKNKKVVRDRAIAKHEAEKETLADRTKPIALLNPFRTTDTNLEYDEWVKEHTEIVCNIENIKGKVSCLHADLGYAKTAENILRKLEELRKNRDRTEDSVNEASVGNPTSVNEELSRRAALSNLSIQTTQLEELTKEKTKLKQVDLGEAPDHTDVSQIEEELSDITRAIDAKRSIEKFLSSLPEEHTIITQASNEALGEEYEELQNQLSDIKIKYAEYQEYQEIMDELVSIGGTDINAFVDELVQKIEMSTIIGECPCCNTVLCLQSGELVEATSATDGYIQQQDVSALKAQQDTLNDLLKRKDKLLAKGIDKFDPSTLDVMRKRSRLLSKLLILIPKYESLMENDTKRDKSLDELLEQHKTMKRGLSSLNKYYEAITEHNIQLKLVRKREKDLKLKIVELRDNISKYEVDKTISKLDTHTLQGLLIKYQRLNDLKDHLESINTEIKRQNRALSKLPDVKHSEEIIEEIEEVESRRSQLSDRLTHLIDLENKGKDYINYLKELNTYKIHLRRIKQAKMLEENATWEYTQSSKLIEIINKLEAERIQSFIANLNDKVQAYVDDFFPEEPMSIRLDCFKEGKSGASKGIKKANITFSFNYKDYTSDDLGVLSGGEYDRLQLAVCLAFADIAGVPLLMLDESVNSLDDVTCSHVVQKIKSIDRLTLMVAHQVSSEGVFDNIIKLN